jgi:hypothetical protein
MTPPNVLSTVLTFAIYRFTKILDDKKRERAQYGNLALGIDIVPPLAIKNTLLVKIFVYPAAKSRLSVNAPN